MKLKNVSCTQFAGVLNRNVALGDGINVIYGKNESGKSTLVNLISRTLFQNSKVDGRKDKEFKELYFPSAVKGNNYLADFADGKVTFEAQDGEYTLTKEWGVDNRAMLTTPFGVIRDEKTINEILKEKLVYGEGVYKDMLLSSQHNMDLSLQTILDASKKTDAKQEITDAVSKAFAQGDGISIDVIEDAIKNKIDEIEGSHWDESRQLPVYKNGKWSKGVGEILKAYYKYEDARHDLEEIEKLQILADNASTQYNSKNAEIKVLEDLISKLDGFANLLSLQREYQKNAKRYKMELEKYNSVLSNWPKIQTAIEKAKALQKENKNRTLLDLYNNAKAVMDSLNSIDSAVLNAPCPADDEIASVKSAQRNIARLENKLCGMNINANIKMLGGHNVEIKSLRTGEIISLDDNNAVLTEAVKVIVPDVMEMNLTPADVDAEQIQSQIASQTEILNSILKKYEVKDLESLENLAKNINEAKSKKVIDTQKLNMLLGDIKFDDLALAVGSIENDVRSKDEIQSDIFAVCGSNDVDRFITANETIIAGFVADYESVDSLKIKAFDTTNELNHINQKLSENSEIPAEFANIDNPESYLNMQKSKLAMAREVREQALKTKTEATSKLELYMEQIVGDPRENISIAKREFEEQKELLENWKNIYSAFLAQKENMNNNPMEDIATSFAKYLAIISDGRVESSFPEADKLQMNIYSNSHIIDYPKLSEGTKDTVALAFRLAVIDHLFPDGNGVVVFDDPFTDMDKERTEKSCELIKECAKNNQVIVLTCKQDYVDMLGGNLIEM